MKTTFAQLVLICVLAFSAAAEAQQKTTASSTRSNSTKTYKRKTNTSTLAPGQSQVTSLSASSNYSAKAPVNPVTSANTYAISDPTVLALNARANGANTPISKSGIVGMPKRAYGFGTGHLLLYSTGSTSSGTITGTGVVGTGSSLGNIGSYGSGIGLNGKSNYAGSTMWGNATGMQPAHADSAVRRR